MFKKGDLVECVGYFCSGDVGFINGNRYEVSEDYNEGDDFVDILVDSEGEMGNGLNPKYFKLVKEKPMAKNTDVNYLIVQNSMTLNYEGKTLTLTKDDKRYSEVINAIRENRLSDIPGLVELERAFEGSGLELKDGILLAGGSPIPTELNKRILDFKEQGLPYGPLLKFWDNLKKNPSFNARTMLFKFLEHNGIPLTQDGNFIAYRGVNADFKDQHTGTFDNKPGAICQMARELVDDNPNNTCSTGLHVACYEYAKKFGPKLVEVKVNPADVVAVPTDYDGTKMRVCRFEVLQECVVVRTEALTGPQGEEFTSDTEFEEAFEEEELEEESDFDDLDCDSPPEASENLWRCSDGVEGCFTDHTVRVVKAVTESPEVNYRHKKRTKNGQFKKKARKAKKAKKAKRKGRK